MNRKVRYILIAVLAIILMVGMAFVSDLERSSRAGTLCRSIDVTFLDDFHFIDSATVCRLVENKYGRCLNEPLDSLRLSEIEQLLESRSVILKSEAWTTDDGILHLDIQQRAPIIRCDRGDRHLYIDRTGYVFSSESVCSANVPVISGNIPKIENGEEDWVKGVIDLTTFVKDSKSWRDHMEKISVNDKGDLVLKLKEHGEDFIFGKPVEIGDKFERMEKYFTHIAPSLGEGHYKTVNLKYNNQLICRKDI